jgi:thymidylate synthase (FAD)
MSELVDIIAEKFNTTTPQIQCLDHGFVRLIDMMPRLVPKGQTADFRACQAARVSYGNGTKTLNEDTSLLRYLMRHRHTTPLEKIRFEFHVKLPLFVCQQWLRHRTGTFNQLSLRYSESKNEFYIPDKGNLRTQSEKNKQCSEGVVSGHEVDFIHEHLEISCDQTYDQYMQFLDLGLCREQARMILPANLYTEFYWTTDLHNLLHFLALRCDNHAQKEIQDYGNAILTLIKEVVPVSIQAWEDYHPMRGGMLLTKDEVDAFKRYIEDKKTGEYEACFTEKIPEINTATKREVNEWQDKARRFGFN